MTSLEGKKVLIVEDEFLIAQMLCDALTSEHAVVVGPVTTNEGGLQLLCDEPVDVAVIDLNLHGVRSDSLALELGRRHIPFVVATGLCYQSTAEGSPISSFGGHVIQHVSTSPDVSAAAGSVIVGPGTWTVGYCIREWGSSPPINNNSFVNGWVMVG